MCCYCSLITVEFLFFHRPYVILEIGVAVLVVVFLFYFLITRGNPPKDVLFFGNEHNYVYFPTYLQCISKYADLQRLISTMHCVLELIPTPTKGFPELFTRYTLCRSENMNCI